MLRKIILFLFIGTIIGCGTPKSSIVTTRKPVGWKYAKKGASNSTEKATTSVKPITANEATKSYVAQYSNIAMGNMKSYGIPASIILAQGILESGSGKSDLAINANNHFGIKCHNDWTGDKVYKDDDSSQECFRKYNQSAESYQDHVKVLTTKTRYAKLFSLPKDDYRSWAKGLKEAGYATDPKYPEKLISYIEAYNLSQYDIKVLGSKMAKEEANVMLADNFGVDESSLYEIQKGDTFYSVSKKFNLTVDELKQKNNLTENTLSIGQKLLVK